MLAQLIKATHLLAAHGMPSSSEHGSWWWWLICTHKGALTKHRGWEWWLQYRRQTPEWCWRCVVDNIWERCLGCMWWRITVSASGGIIRKELLELLLEGRHVLVLLLKLCIALIEALKNLVLLLHVTLLIKETLESLVGFLLPLLILLEWIPTLNKERKTYLYATDAMATI